jgi:DNA-binding winged helix-turn-helix (wHTH) protein
MSHIRPESHKSGAGILQDRPRAVSESRSRFGPFELDPPARRLLRQESPVHLTPKAYLLLTELVSVSPRALSKQELQERLWPSTFVDEANLSVLVAELRAALEDDARHPRYIRTVHGFGYAFEAAVIRDRPPEARDRRNAVWWLVSDRDQFRLEPGEAIVGREPAAGVWVDAASVSRRHARLRVDEASVQVEDLASKNGTWVNGQRVTDPVELSDGDEVRFGSVVMRIRHLPNAGSTETLGPL